MQLCLDLAARGGSAVAPNPMVGAVIVHQGRVIGSGWHSVFGGPHAEVVALSSVEQRELLPQSELYVSLEPCAHYGKTPPCTEAILAAGIPKVVVGCRDPFARVAGRGIAQLSQAGVQVVAGELERECIRLNRRFFTFQILNRPYIVLKWAETADGFIARTDYTSKWISGPESRQRAHELRASEAAVLVGTNTARHDDPQLNVRLTQGRDPLRLVIDRRLSLPANLKLFQGPQPTWIFNSEREEISRALRWIKIDFDQGVPQQIVECLQRENIISVLIEGGAAVLQSFIAADLWDEAFVFQSQTKFGTGIAAPSLQKNAAAETASGADRCSHYENHWIGDLLSNDRPLLLRLGGQDLET